MAFEKRKKIMDYVSEGTINVNSAVASFRASHVFIGGGSTPKNPNPKWDFKLFLGFLGFFRKRCGKYFSQHS